MPKRTQACTRTSAKWKWESQGMMTVVLRSCCMGMAGLCAYMAFLASSHHMVGLSFRGGGGGGGTALIMASGVAKMKLCTPG